MKLPKTFLDNMKQLLGAEEYESWLASYQDEPLPGLRINTAKISTDAWENHLSMYPPVRIPWTPNGYYYPRDEKPARHPYYYAGLYYLQEPSAMLPARLLPIEPGDRVLDLCAAPGGKSTELGARLKQKGLLVANDLSVSRAQALLKNLELSGLLNILVTAEAPDRLAETFGMFFDKILVDAPCSGEGMFRKDPALIKSWEEKGPRYYAPVQQKILAAAVRMLVPGGYLLYSTCTFTREENEDNIIWLLKQHPELELCPLKLFPQAAPGLDGLPVIRLYPHKIKGEGHFAALLRKKVTAAFNGGNAFTGRYPEQQKELNRLIRETDFPAFAERLKMTLKPERLMVKQDQLYYLPELFDSRWRLRYLRTGLLLGECRRGRFQPSQALALALTGMEYHGTLSLTATDERVLRYLSGETIALKEQETPEKGWCLIGVDGFPMGWAKYDGRIFKNKYYPGWRRQS